MKMKRIFYFAAMAAFAVGLTSCSDDDLVGGDSLKGNGTPIGVNVTENGTRATEATLGTLKSDGFKLYAFSMADSPSATTLGDRTWNLNNPFDVVWNSTNNYWEVQASGTNVAWQTESDLEKGIFYALYSPKGISTNNIKSSSASDEITSDFVYTPTTQDKAYSTELNPQIHPMKVDEGNQNIYRYTVSENGDLLKALREYEAAHNGWSEDGVGEIYYDDNPTDDQLTFVGDTPDESTGGVKYYYVATRHLTELNEDRESNGKTALSITLADISGNDADGSNYVTDLDNFGNWESAYGTTDIKNVVTPDNISDLMLACDTASIDDHQGAINLSFDHLLSQVQFKIGFNNDYFESLSGGDASTGTRIFAIVRAITLHNVVVDGTYAINDDGDKSLTKGWNKVNTTNGTIGAVRIEAATPMKFTNAADETGAFGDYKVGHAIFEASDSMFVLPQTTKGKFLYDVGVVGNTIDASTGRLDTEAAYADIECIMWYVTDMNIYRDDSSEENIDTRSHLGTVVCSALREGEGLTTLGEDDIDDIVKSVGYGHAYITLHGGFDGGSGRTAYNDYDRSGTVKDYTFTAGKKQTIKLNLEGVFVNDAGDIKNAWEGIDISGAKKHTGSFDAKKNK